MAPISTTANGHSENTNGTILKATAPAFHPTGTPDPSKYHAASTDEAIHSEHAHSAHNYHPLPIVFSRAAGTSVWDPEGKQYLDFLSAYGAVNQGHCHPELIKALTEQASRLTLSSRAFYNDVFPRFAEFVTKFFGFDTVLPMNTGAEAVETAVKIARKWGYKVKGIPQNEALVLSVTENFHGRTVSGAALDLQYYEKAYTNVHSFLQSPCRQILSLEIIMVRICPTLAPIARRPNSPFHTTILRLSNLPSLRMGKGLRPSLSSRSKARRESSCPMIAI